MSGRPAVLLLTGLIAAAPVGLAVGTLIGQRNTRKWRRAKELAHRADTENLILLAERRHHARHR